MRIPKFRIYTSSNGQFYFTLLATNGEVIATSEMYQTEASCRKGIRSVRKNAVIAITEDCTDL